MGPTGLINLSYEFCLSPSKVGNGQRSRRAREPVGVEQAADTLRPKSTWMQQARRPLADDALTRQLLNLLSLNSLQERHRPGDAPMTVS
jgi:hypothetical protein